MRAGPQDITRHQLTLLLLGYQEPTGRRADVLEALNLDDKGEPPGRRRNDSRSARG